MSGSLVAAGVIDAAQSITEAPSEDYDGGSRPHGSASDVGADEASSAAALPGSSWGAVKGRFRR